MYNLAFMENYASYFAPGPEGSVWGATLTACGYTRVEKGSAYPPGRHPLDHLFTWKRGRVLGTYQMIYILEGTGRFESPETGAVEVTGGTVIWLFPGVWHRYRPEPSTGWVESWVEMQGAAMERLEKAGLIGPGMPVVKVGRVPEVERVLEEIHRVARARRAGSGPVLGMLGLQAVARLRQARVAKPSTAGSAAEAVRRAQEEMAAQLDRLVTIEALAEGTGVSYSALRHAFKAAVGMSPKQYHLQMRLRKAQELLRNTELTVGRIAEALGFGSGFHLSACFKRHFGVSPAAWRRAGGWHDSTR